MMTYHEFVDMVSEMRRSQKSYFRTRSAELLNRSKSLEREVDLAIEKFYSPHGDLFEGLRS